MNGLHGDLRLHYRRSDLRLQSGRFLLMRELEGAAVVPGTALKTERPTVQMFVEETCEWGSEQTTHSDWMKPPVGMLLEGLAVWWQGPKGVLVMAEG